MDDDVAREALRASVDFARYWQEPDETDVAAALPGVRAALRPIAEMLCSSSTGAQWSAPRSRVQWAVDWRVLADAAPLISDSATVLSRWTADQRIDEERATRERPRDPTAKWSGTWWSVPHALLTTRGRVADVLELVEDSLGWDTATVIPVRGGGRTLEVTGAADWIELCRYYPLEVTASRRHDWYRVTGRDGRWLIPHWERVAEDWDAVHLTTLGYLSTATRLIEIDAEHASVIGGWAPDSTVWLTDTAREWEEARQQWTRLSGHGEWESTPHPAADTR